MADDKMTFTLTRDEFEVLLLMMGYATGAAFKENPRLAHSFLELANRVNKDSPNWKPYQIPDEFKSEKAQ